MYSEEELQFMTPKMSIEYRVEQGFLHSGTFDNIPENAFGAHICTHFPTVAANGEFRFSSDSFDLFVGETFEVKDLLSQINKPSENSETVIVANNIAKETIKEYEKAGVKRVVSTKSGVIPLRYGDAAFSTHEEMAQAITKISQTFNSVNISVQNQEAPKMHR